jgi:PAS domain S-box-containing protein
MALDINAVFTHGAYEKSLIYGCILLIVIIVILFVRSRKYIQLGLLRTRLLTSITREFKKPFNLGRIFTGVLDLMMVAMPRLKGVMIVIYGKPATKDKLRIIKGMQADYARDFKAGASFQKRLREVSSLLITSEKLRDRKGKRFKYVLCLPFIIRRHVAGAILMGTHTKLSQADVAYLQMAISEISLEFGNRLLQSRLDVFSKEPSLVEYPIENIVDNLPSGVAVIDPEKQVLLFNDKMKSITKTKNAIGIDYLDLFSSSKTKKEVRQFLERVMDEHALATIDHLRYTANGTTKILNMTAYPLLDIQNNVIAYTIVHEDVTNQYFLQKKLKETQEKAHQELKEKIRLSTSELVDANKELIRLNRLKSEFVSVISHELKTPLTSITGYIKLLESGRMGELTKKQKESLEIVSEESDRLAHLINDVLDLSRLESGKTTLKLEKAMLKPIIQKAIELIKPQVRQKKVKIEAPALKKGVASKKIAMDPAKIRQAITNLVSNAIKFTSARGAITIDAYEKSGTVYVSVKDTGIGISEDEQKHLFEPFYQVGEHLTRNAQGTGLGLTITKHIIDLHQGTIEVKSAVGKGTTVTIGIPKNLEQEFAGAAIE